MNNDRQLNYVNNLQNRDQNLYYVDDTDELNNINLKENDKIYAINDNKLFQMEIADQEEELSGSIVSFNGRNNTKIKSLVVNIEPVQNLHGYDAPWPAGGGKNLFDKDNVSVINAYIDETIVSSSGQRTIYIPCKANTTYTVQKIAVAAGSSDRLTVAWTNTTPASGVTVYGKASKSSGFVIGNKVSLATTTGEDAQYLVVWISQSEGYTASLPTTMIEEGSTVSNYAPYSNICPISGCTGANVTRTGKNLFDKTKYEYARYLNQASGTASVSSGTPRWDVSDYIRVKGNTVYISSPWSVSTRSEWCFYDSNKQFISGVSSASRKQRTPPDAVYLRVDFPHPSLESFQLEEGSSATPTQAYEGQVIDIDWADTAGTVHGGTLTINSDGSADLVSTHIIYNIQPSQWTWMSSSRCFKIDRTSLSPRYKVFGSNVDSRVADIACDKYKPNTFNNIANSVGSPNYSVGIREYNAQWIALRTDGTNSVLPKECQIKLPLADPITYHISDAGQLKASLGVNNIWADISDITIKIAEKGITAFELEPHI